MKLTSKIRKERGVLLSPKFFGREIHLKVLYSPSGSANVGISRSKLYLNKKGQYKNHLAPVLAFKIDYYREMFS
jgi:hypothetical protein